MTKKNRKSKDEQPTGSFEKKVRVAFERIHIDTTGNESEEEKVDLTGTTPAGNETAASNPESESREAGETQGAEASDEGSVDDLLDDVRRSLIEDEAQSSAKNAGWLSRITKGFHKDSGSTEPPPDLESNRLEVDIPINQPKEDQYVDQIDELIEMLEPEAGEEQPEAVAMTEPQPEPTPEPEPEPPPDVEELKKRVFGPHGGGEFQEMSEVRAVALEGSEEVFVEVEAKKEDATQERRKAFENALRPYRQYVYFAVAFLGVVLAGLAAGFLYTVYQRSRPPEPTPVVSNLPHPVAMSLPGGLNFNLGRGAIMEGEWNPVGPEWLVGTEICRWVAIPWSRQLEAVVRTLTPEDSIELVMSNDDRLEYSVISRAEMTLAEMQALDQNSPCLLLVLAEQEAEKRWVVVAQP